MPTLLPSLLLIFSLTFTNAQTDFPILDNFATQIFSIPLDDSLTLKIDLPPRDNTTLRLDWLTTDLSAFPSTIFFLSNTTDSPIRTNGFSLEYNKQFPNRQCSSIQPCSTVSTIDFVAFYTRSKHSFLRYSLSSTTPETIYVTILNYNTKVENPNPFTPPPPKILSGTLSARFITDPNNDCPAVPPESSTVCMGRGQCQNHRCQCQPPFDGRLCETQIIPLPDTNTPPPDQPFLIDPLSDSYTARVDLFSSAVFAVTQQRPDERIILNIRILRGFIQGNNTDLSLQSPRLVIFSSPPPLGEPLLNENVTLPTLGRENAIVADTRASLRLLSTPQPMPVGDVLYVAFFAFPNSDITDAFALVNIKMDTCNVNECGPRPSNVTLELALVPAFLVTTAVAAVGVLIMLWLDRRHGFTSNVDRLSTAEIERMYPKTDYSGETLECSICLCEIESGHSVRKLQCSHIYHNECLDPWLTENRASCPTCRNDVRVEQLSDKRRMRRVVQFFLAPIVYLRRLRDRRRAPELDQHDPSDLEAGDTGHTLTPQPNDQGNNTVNDNVVNNGNPGENADTTTTS